MSEKKPGGFTLVELLVVIAIIGVLVALLLPAVQAAREAARRTQCVNQIRQLGLACHNYHDSHGRFPSAGDEVIAGSEQDSIGLSWLAQILPYIENANLQDIVDTSVNWNHPNNDAAEQTPVPLFQCPTTGPELPVYVEGPGGDTNIEAPSELRAHYVGIMGAKSRCPLNSRIPYPESGYTMMTCGESGGLADNGTIIFDGEIRFKDITDGTTHTMMVGEQSWESGPTRSWIVGTLDQNSGPDGHGWLYNSKNVMHPLNTAFREKPDESLSGYANNDTSLGSMHPSGFHVAMADGSSKFINEDTGLNVLRAMATRANDDNDNPELKQLGGR